MLYQDWDVELRGSRVRITPMRSEDDPAYGRLLIGDSYDRFTDVLEPETVSGIRSILNHTEDAETHALRLLDDDAFIGWIVLQKDPEGRPDIGISLVEEYRNKGLGPEAVALFANRLYSEYGIDRIFMRISGNNLQSQKAFFRMGAVLDKREPDYRMTGILDAFPEGMKPETVVSELLFVHLDLPVGPGAK